MKRNIVIYSFLFSISASAAIDWKPATPPDWGFARYTNPNEQEWLGDLIFVGDSVNTVSIMPVFRSLGPSRSDAQDRRYLKLQFMQYLHGINILTRISSANYRLVMPGDNLLSYIPRVINALDFFNRILEQELRPEYERTRGLIGDHEARENLLTTMTRDPRLHPMRASAPIALIQTAEVNPIGNDMAAAASDFLRGLHNIPDMGGSRDAL